jgi:transposase
MNDIKSVLVDLIHEMKDLKKSNDDLKKQITSQFVTPDELANMSIKQLSIFYGVHRNTIANWKEGGFLDHYNRKPNQRGREF